MLQVLDFSKEKVLVMFIVVISFQNYELFDWAMQSFSFPNFSKKMQNI